MTADQYLRARGWTQGAITPSGWTPAGWSGWGDLSEEDAVKKQLDLDIAVRTFVDAELERRSLVAGRAGVGEELVLRGEPVTRPIGPPRSSQR